MPSVAQKCPRARGRMIARTAIDPAPREHAHRERERESKIDADGRTETLKRWEIHRDDSIEREQDVYA